MSPAAENVIERLDGARQKWWLFSLLTTAVLAACVSLATILALIVADAFLKFSQGWLLGMRVGLDVAERRAGGDRRSAAAGRPAESRSGGPPRGSRISRARQQPDQSGAAFRGHEEREPGVSRGRHQRGGRADRRACRSTVRPPASRARGDCCYCMQTPRDLAESLAVLALLIAVAVLCQTWIPAWGSTVSRLLDAVEVRSFGRIGQDRPRHARQCRGARRRERRDRRRDRKPRRQAASRPGCLSPARPSPNRSCR